MTRYLYYISIGSVLLFASILGIILIMQYAFGFTPFIDEYPTQTIILIVVMMGFLIISSIERQKEIKLKHD